MCVISLQAFLPGVLALFWWLDVAVLVPSKRDKFSTSGTQGDAVPVWVLLLGGQRDLPEDRTPVQHQRNGNHTGSWACWRAGGRRENLWARKPY